MANTGRVEKEQRDVNPNSPTFGQTRWVDAGFDTTACPLPQAFRSTAIQENVAKNDCPDGQFGSSVLVSLAAGAFTSTVSQVDANAQARAAFDNTKQIFANQNGTCSANPGGTVTWVPLYNAEGCFDCTMQNADESGDLRAATSQEIAQYYRRKGSDGLICPTCTP